MKLTEKRFTTIESGIDYGVIDNTTDERIFDVDISAKLNDLNDENEQLQKELADASKLLDGLTIPELLDLVHTYEKENEQLKQFQEQVAEVIESKMGDNVCNDYKMEVLKEIWNELELDEVWFE